MADAKQKKPKMTSPRGIFIFPKLSEPDYGNDSYPKPDGEYSVQLELDAENPKTKAFLAALEPHYKAALQMGEEEFKKMKVETRKKLGAVKANDLFTTLYDQETEEPTGMIRFKFAMKASGLRKKDNKPWSREPALFDARGAAINPKKKPQIWSGTEGCVSFEIGPYFIPGTGAVGLKLALEAAQIIELSSGNVRSASQYGFGAHDDGFSQSDYVAPEGDDEDGEEGDQAGAPAGRLPDLDDDIPF